MGVQGATLVGPTGPVGSTGGTGSQGMSGQTGERGSITAGNVGSAGVSGAQGMPGPSGPMGAQGPVGAIGRWTEYRDFTFNPGTADITAGGRNTAAEIATYLSNNPSLQLGIDGVMDPADQNLGGPRVNAVLTALTMAGVPNSSIRRTMLNDPHFTPDGSVEVLLSSSR
jgi:outer membrane protein OmpA-like peptidoglycan-associated protein